MLSSVVLTLAMTGVLVQADAGKLPEAPGEAALIELGKELIGEWEGVITLDSDVPGLGKAGDKIQAESAVRWIWNRTAVECNGRVGIARYKWIAIAGTTPGEVRLVIASSDGDSGTGIASKQAGKWTLKQTMIQAKGQKRTQVATLTIEENGRRHLWTYTNVLVDGQTRPDTTDVYERVQSKTKQ